MIPPESQYNQWSCTLACFVWNMKKDGHLSADQKELVRTHSVDFPKWGQGHEGLLTRGGLIDLNLRYVPFRKIIHTQDSDDCKDYLNRNYHLGFLGGYVLTRKPTNHCMAIQSWNLDQISLMDPTPPASYRVFDWKDLEKNFDADFLMFFR